MAFVILLALVVVLAWSLKNPFVGLLGMLVLFVLRPGEIYPVLGALRVELLSAIVVLGSTLAHHRGFAVPKITKTVLGFWLAMFAAVPLAFWKAQALSFTLDFGQIVVYHLLIVTLVNTEARFRKFVTTFALLMGWLGGSSLYLYLSGSFVYTMGIQRATGLTSAGGDPNTLALTLVSGLPMVLLLLTPDMTKLLRLTGLGIAGVSIVTIINTGSRSAFFVLLMVTFAFVATRQKRFIYVPVIVVTLLVAWTFIPAQYKTRYETVNNLDNDQSYQNRIRAWRAGWEMFKDNPLTGIGAGNFAYASGAQYWEGEGRKHWLNAHSLPIKAIGELGIVGTSAFIL
jgi:putative inorganic carbon (hco3(-)) transporter